MSKQAIQFAALALTAAGVLAATGCSSSAKPPVSGSTTSSTVPQSPSGGSATPSSGSGNAGGGASSKNVLNVSGAFTATAPQSTLAYQAQCTPTGSEAGPAGGIVIFYDTVGKSGPANIYEVDMTFMPAGKTTAFPLVTAPVGAGPTVRFSYQADNGYLDWGKLDAAPGATAAPAQGTVTMAADTKTGSFDIQLPFLGNDAHTIPAGSKPAVHITGSWTCSA